MQATNKKKGVVGVVGLGIMGGAFANNLAAAGWHVMGHDPSEPRTKEAAASGVEIARSAGDVAAKAPIIITSLPNAAALNTTVKSIVAAKLPRRVLVEAGTFTLEEKMAAEREFKAGGHVMLDCPVSGTGSQAKVKDLVIYASGDAATFETLRPLFADFSRQAHHLGAFGNGMRMKLVANLLVAIHNVASAEAMVLGMKAGLDPHQVVKLIAAGAGNSRVFELRAPMMADNHYDSATMKVSIWQKDMAVIGSFARQIGCPTPLFDATSPIYAKALAGGHANDDTASVCAVLEEMAGIKR